MKNKEKILVLGADGFIGSNLVKSLLVDGYIIRAFDLFKDGQSRNLEDVRGEVEIFPGNFLNKDDISRALENIDYVFHFISLTTPGSSMNDPLIDVDTNIRGTIMLLEECVNKKIKKIIFSSSGGSIYGNQKKDLFTEEDGTQPISPYAISKLAIEKYLEYYRLHMGLDYLILRYANPYGIGQNVVGSQGIIPIFLNLVKQNKKITVFGDGENIRDYVYIDDAIEMTKRIFNINTKYKIYNVGSGMGVSINEVINILEVIVGKKIDIERQPARDIDVQKIVLNNERILKEVDFKPEIMLQDGIIKTWNWLNNK
jgi:UDP-glucose 4-epimerase